MKNPMCSAPRMNKLALAVALGVGQGAWLSAMAAGNVDLVRGEVSVVNRDGQPRGITKGDRVVQGETVVTGNDGELLLTTDDSGVLAVRPRSRLLIDDYKVNGGQNDSVLLRLLRGGLRSITGWVSKTAPRNYRIITPTATVGIRGTDHEVAVVEGGPDEGSTLNQVTTGQTTLSTPAGSINLDAGQVGATTSLSNPPQPLPTAPPGVFVPRATDTRVGELKQDAEGQQEQRLRARQQQNQRSGGASEQGNPRVSGQCVPGSPATQVFADLLRAYERGDAAFLQRRLNPAMIGYGALINEVMSDNAAQRQTRIQVLDMQLQCGPDVAVIDFLWEKRYLRSNDFTPQIERGRSSVLLTDLGGGGAGGWQLSGLVGDSPFKPTQVAAPNSPGSPNTPSLGKAGSLNATASVNYSALGQSSLPVSVNLITPQNPPTFTVNVVAGATATCSVTGFAYSCSASYPGATGVVTPSASVSPSQCVVSGTPFLGGSGPMSYSAKSVTQNSLGAGGAKTTVSVPINLVGNGTLASSGSFPVSNFIDTLCNVDVLFPAVEGNIPVLIEVQDADVTATSVQVQLSASNGDAQALNLPQVAPGVFRLSQLPAHFGAPSVLPNNGSIELPAQQGPVTLTLSYTDALPGAAGGPVQRRATMLLDPGAQTGSALRRAR
jgi:hypothetical protein